MFVPTLLPPTLPNMALADLMTLLCSELTAVRRNNSYSWLRTQPTVGLTLLATSAILLGCSVVVDTLGR